jgi:hypothetical protein
LIHLISSLHLTQAVSFYISLLRDELTLSGRRDTPDVSQSLLFFEQWNILCINHRKMEVRYREIRRCIAFSTTSKSPKNWSRTGYECSDCNLGLCIANSFREYLYFESILIHFDEQKKKKNAVLKGLKTLKEVSRYQHHIEETTLLGLHKEFRDKFIIFCIQPSSPTPKP